MLGLERRPRHRWSEEENQVLRRDYDRKNAGALADAFDLPLYTIRAQLKRLKLTRVKEPPWTQEELEYLSDRTGVISDEAISRHLNRSKNALKIARYRKLGGVTKWTNVFSARAVARELGVS